MKKILIIYLTIFSILISFVACGNSYAQFETMPLADGESIRITGYTGEGGRVRIPSRINNLQVTEIGERAFAGRGLTSVSIPNSVTVIGDEAFSDNQLTSVTIPNAVTRIGEWAFFGNRLTSVTIPNSVAYIEARSFSRNQLTSVTIPDSVTRIGMFAFSHNQLPSVTIPESVTLVLNGAFYHNHLTRITIGSNVSLFGPMSLLVSSPAFDESFDAFYIQQGFSAGTYIYIGLGFWSKE